MVTSKIFIQQTCSTTIHQKEVYCLRRLSQMRILLLTFHWCTIKIKHIHGCTSMSIIIICKHSGKILITTEMSQTHHFKVVIVNGNNLISLTRLILTANEHTTNLILIIFLCFRQLLKIRIAT